MLWLRSVSLVYTAVPLDFQCYQNRRMVSIEKWGHFVWLARKHDENYENGENLEIMFAKNVWISSLQRQYSSICNRRPEVDRRVVWHEFKVVYWVHALGQLCRSLSHIGSDSNIYSDKEAHQYTGRHEHCRRAQHWIGYSLKLKIDGAWCTWK